eukprot:SAG22_NODE_139_length_18025_cov_4.352058_4_plen_1082_part_00
MEGTGELPRPEVARHLAARGCKVEARPGRQRCLVAARPLPAGSVVLRCEAFASVLRPQYWGQRCNACLRRPADDGSPGRKLLCCGKCKRQFYCDRQCQLAEWPDHKSECKRLQRAEQLLPADALADSLLLGRAMRSPAAATVPPPEPSSGDGGTLQATKADVAAMAWHAEDEPDVRELATVTGPRGSNPIGLYSSTEGGDTAAAAEKDAAKLLCQFQCNNFGVSTELLAAVGKAVFPAGALLNHSCAPNVVLSYSLGEVEAGETPRRRRPVMECRTLRHVAADEELCHNFIDIANPTVERRASLSRLYHFVCECERCAAATPESRRADQCFRAPHPDFANGPKQAKERDRLLKQAAKLLSEAEQCEAGASGEAQEAKLVRKAVALRRKVSHPLSLDVYEANAASYKLALSTADLGAALGDCSRMVEFLRLAYAHVPNHPMLGIQLYTLGNLRGELAMADPAGAGHPGIVPALQQAVAELHEARKGLSVCFGTESAFVQELDGLIKYYTDECSRMSGGATGSEQASLAEAAVDATAAAAAAAEGEAAAEAAVVAEVPSPAQPSKRSLKKQAKLARIRSAKIAAGGIGVRADTPWRDSNSATGKGCAGKVDTGALAVQCTNDESIVSKRSAVRAGYYTDDFVRHFVSKAVRRAPLINRGYYIRIAAVRGQLRRMAEEWYPGEQTQVLSFGAGFDSTYFHLADTGGLPSKYVEVDYPELASIKIRMIQNTPELSGHVPGAAVSRDGTLLAASQYGLAGCDLRQLQTLPALLEEAGLDLSKPTLCLAECVMTYMPPGDSSALVEWVAANMPRAVFVCYEQVRPHDGFAATMLQTLKRRNSPLMAIQSYPLPQAQLRRFQALGWPHVEVRDMNSLYYDWLPIEDRQRIERAEPFDELEEWHLKCCHYTVLTATMEPKLSVPQGLPPATVASPGEPATRPGCFFSTVSPEDLGAEAEQEAAGTSVGAWEPMQAAERGRLLAGRRGHALVSIGGAQLVCYGGFGPSGHGGKKQARMATAEIIEVVPSDTAGGRLCYRSHLVPAAGEVPGARCSHAAAVADLNNDESTTLVVIFGGRQVSAVCPRAKFA